MDREADIIAAWRTIDLLRFADPSELRDMLPALAEMRDNLESLLA